MAECKVSKTVKYVLYLSEEEANFIKGLCQNEYPGVDETPHTKKLREGIFHAIHDTNFT
jgi:hypothetical protein